jgi:hypothetical protein
VEIPGTPHRVVFVQGVDDAFCELNKSNFKRFKKINNLTV